LAKQQKQQYIVVGYIALR